MSGYCPTFSAIEERALGLVHSSNAPYTTKYIAKPYPIKDLL